MVYLCIQSHIVPKNPKKISGEVKLTIANIEQQGGCTLGDCIFGYLLPMYYLTLYFCNSLIFNDFNNS